MLDYLADQGGTVESADGLGLVRAMADALGYEGNGGLNAMLAGLERDGLVAREVRGRRTYRIALTTAPRRRRPRPPAEPATERPGRQEAAEPEAAGADPVAVPGAPAAKRRWWRRAKVAQ